MIRKLESELMDVLNHLSTMDFLLQLEIIALLPMESNLELFFDLEI